MRRKYLVEGWLQLFEKARHYLAKVSRGDRAILSVRVRSYVTENFISINEFEIGPEQAFLSAAASENEVSAFVFESVVRRTDMGNESGINLHIAQPIPLVR